MAVVDVVLVVVVLIVVTFVVSGAPEHHPSWSILVLVQVWYGDTHV